MNGTLDKLRAHKKQAAECRDLAHAVAIVEWRNKQLDFTAQTVEATAALLYKFLDRLVTEYAAHVRKEASPPPASE